MLEEETYRCSVCALPEPEELPLTLLALNCPSCSASLQVDERTRRTRCSSCQRTCLVADAAADRGHPIERMVAELALRRLHAERQQVQRGLQTITNMDLLQRRERSRQIQEEKTIRGLFLICTFLGLVLAVSSQWIWGWNWFWYMFAFSLLGTIVCSLKARALPDVGTESDTAYVGRHRLIEKLRSIDAEAQHHRQIVGEEGEA